LSESGLEAGTVTTADVDLDPRLMTCFFFVVLQNYPDRQRLRDRQRDRERERRLVSGSSSIV